MSMYDGCSMRLFVSILECQTEVVHIVCIIEVVGSSNLLVPNLAKL